MRTRLIPVMEILPPRPERFREGALAERALLSGEYGTLAAGEEDRDVEPVALLGWLTAPVKRTSRQRNDVFRMKWVRRHKAKTF